MGRRWHIPLLFDHPHGERATVGNSGKVSSEPLLGYENTIGFVGHMDVDHDCGLQPLSHMLAISLDEAGKGLLLP